MRILAVVPVLLLAGCAGPVSSELRATHLAPDGPVAAVAVIDSGINPYHPVFWDPGAELPSSFIDALTGEAPTRVRLTLGEDYDTALESDADIWKSLEPGRLYWFEGTRILGLSLRPSEYSRWHVFDRGSHGTEVASVLRNVSTDVWIVVLSDIPMSLRVEAVDEVSKTYVRGIRWAAEQPWIDLVSMSIGFPANPPGIWEAAGYPEASRKLVGTGKLLLNAAGNQPNPPLLAGNMGMPWVITVGGVESPTRGDVVHAARMVDVVSDWAAWVPGDDGQLSRGMGTSFAVPRVAGNVAQAILTLRQQGANASMTPEFAGRLRETLNASAAYWNTTDYRAQNHPNDTFDLLLSASAPIAPTPWVQMGWGYVGNDTWRTMVEALQGNPPPPKPDAARAYMAQQHALREAYWSQRSPTP